MDFTLENTLPIWKQISSRLEEGIITGEYPAGSRLPSVRDLAAEAKVNPNTMQRAMAKLEADGLVVTNRTAGRTVTDDAAVIDMIRTRLAAEHAQGYLEKMKALGFSAGEALAFVQKGIENE